VTAVTAVPDDVAQDDTAVDVSVLAASVLDVPGEYLITPTPPTARELATVLAGACVYVVVSCSTRTG
jgi:hypothetical protein